MKSKFLIVLCVLLGVLVIGCSTTTTTTVASVDSSNQGRFGEVNIFPAKDFNGLGLVFTEVTLTTTVDGANTTINGEAFTYQRLLKEAQKLNAETIINVVIDKKTEVVTTSTNTFNPFSHGNVSTVGKKTTQTTYYGSALAIKYTTLLTRTDTVENTETNQKSTTTSPIFGGTTSNPVSSGSGVTAALTESGGGVKGFFDNLFKK
jgi:hypothetical protein